MLIKQNRIDSAQCNGNFKKDAITACRSYCTLSHADRCLDCLENNEIRTMDKKKTLLHVLMGWAKQKEPDLLLLDQDLVHTTEASHWGLDDLKNQAISNFTEYNTPRSMIPSFSKSYDATVVLRKDASLERCRHVSLDRPAVPTVQGCVIYVRANINIG